MYKIFFVFKRMQKKRIERDKGVSVFYQKILDRIEWYYNKCVREYYVKYPSDEYGLNTEYRKEKVIVSLTSFPQRINTVWITVETLLRQSVKADKIILWLAEEQFESMDSLPRELLRLQSRGLTIRFCEDLRSHKKYFFAMQEFPNDMVVLVDDDMFYPYDTLKQLLKLHKKYPEDICTMTAQVMAISENKNPSEWRNPRVTEVYEHSNQIQIFTGSGSLYPPKSLYKCAFDEELIKKLCPYADDLWLTFMAYKKGTKITTKAPWRAFPITIYGTSVGSLWYVNVADGKNDEQWNAIQQYFNRSGNDY